MWPICSLWDYNPENDDERGHNWNGANFSWFSNLRAVPRISGKTLALAQVTKELDAGGRILDAVVQPYATKTAGVPLKFEYEMATGSSAYSRAVPLSGSASETDEENTAAQQQAHVSGPSVHTSPLTGHPPLPARETVGAWPQAHSGGPRTSDALRLA